MDTVLGEIERDLSGRQRLRNWIQGDGNNTGSSPVWVFFIPCCQGEQGVGVGGGGGEGGVGGGGVLLGVAILSFTGVLFHIAPQREDNINCVRADNTLRKLGETV